MSRFSRVIHVRLSDRTLYLLYKYKDSAFTLAPSTLVNETLSDIIDKLIGMNIVQDTDDEGACQALDDMLAAPISNNKQYQDDPLALALQGICNKSSNYKEVETIKEEQKDPIIPDDKKSSPNEQILLEDEVELSPIPPWKSADITSFAFLRQRAPKDAIIELAVAEKNPALIRSIECIYSNIPTELWGGDKAQSLIADILPTIQKYLDIGDE